MTDEIDSPPEIIPLRAYGVSASSINEMIEHLLGRRPSRKEPIKTEETGLVLADSELLNRELGVSDCSGCTGSECDLICILSILVVMLVVSVVWLTVMIAFSVVTLGGFFKRRYRSVVLVEHEHREFLTKLSIMILRKGGALDYSIGDPEYDEAITNVFLLYGRLKIIRQLSILLGTVWGTIEMAFRLNNILFNPNLEYNLWPLRFIMVGMFLPMMFYCVYLEYRFRRAFSDADEASIRVIMTDPAMNPDTPVSLSKPAWVLDEQYSGSFSARASEQDTPDTGDSIGRDDFAPG